MPFDSQCSLLISVAYKLPHSARVFAAPAFCEIASEVDLLLLSASFRASRTFLMKTRATRGAEGREAEGRGGEGRSLRVSFTVHEMLDEAFRISKESSTGCCSSAKVNSLIGESRREE
eukprot:746912-Hanusia_phi.AAC.6